MSFLTESSIGDPPHFRLYIVRRIVIMAIRMGTMYELNRSRIVEIENEKEAKKERCRMVCISSAIVFLLFLAILNTDLFSQINVLNKCSLLTGLLMISLSAYLISKEQYRSDIVRTLMCTGVALFISSMFVLM